MAYYSQIEALLTERDVSSKQKPGLSDPRCAGFFFPCGDSCAQEGGLYVEGWHTYTIHYQIDCTEIVQQAATKIRDTIGILISHSP